MAIRPRRNTKDRFTVLVKTFAKVAEPRYLDGLGRELAPKVSDLIEDGFSRETDPYGVGWAIRKRNYPWPILSRTPTMRYAFRIWADRNGLRIDNREIYFEWQQGGTKDKTLVPRMMVPEEVRGLGDWDAPLSKIVNDYVETTFRGL